jgi:hypothetical protein
MSISIPTVNSKVGKCMILYLLNSLIPFCIFEWFCSLHLHVKILSDLVTKLLNQGGRCYTFVAHDPDLRVDVVIKMILLGPKESEMRISRQKVIDKEIKIGLVVAKESRYLVSYTEVFEWMDCFCIKMEYCILGDLQRQFDAGKIFSEEA